MEGAGGSFAARVSFSQTNFLEVLSISEQYKYQIGKNIFIVSPVYREGPGEAMTDILLKLMEADVEAESILADGSRQRYNIDRNTACLTAGRRST